MIIINRCLLLSFKFGVPVVSSLTLDVQGLPFRIVGKGALHGCDKVGDCIEYFLTIVTEFVHVKFVESLFASNAVVLVSVLLCCLGISFLLMVILLLVPIID